MTVIIDTNGKQFIPRPPKRNCVKPIDPESKDNKYKSNKEKQSEHKRNPKRLVDRYV